MKKFLTGSLLIIICSVACNTPEEHRIYSPGKLPATYFTIDTRKDTLVQTPNGTTIFIPAGAIKTAKESAFRLEVKEAVTVADIVLNGLITRSHDEPLSSGGMIRLLPADDPAAAIIKPLTVKLHTSRVVPGMLLYKGVTGKDSIVNWTDPQPMQVVPLTEDLVAGRQLFRMNCNSCHDMSKKLTGPPLLHVTAKHSREWLDAYIRNNAAVMASGDCYANTLFREYNRTMMPTFTNLKAKEMDQLLIWMESESKRIDAAGYELTRKKRDSCELFLLASNELLMKAKSSLVDHVLRTRALDTHYDFMITAFGWWNADVPLEDHPASVKSYLSVGIAGPVSTSAQVFLAIPEQGVFLQGGLLAGKKDEYGFFRKDGYIYFPQQNNAYVMVIDDQQGRFMFGSTRFKTSLRETLFVTLQPSSPAAYESAVRQLSGKGTDTGADVPGGSVSDEGGWEMSAPASARWPKPVAYKCGCDSSKLSLYR